MSLGHKIEDIVENLCEKSFFADFTVRNPKYRKSGGLEKEAADILVIFENTLIAIQVKSKHFSSPPSQKCRIQAERVSKTIDKTIRQFRGLVEALNSPSFKLFRNGRGVEIEFDKKTIKEFIFIVIFAPIWGDDSEVGRIQFDTTCYPEDAIAIHIFTLKQFSLLLSLLNTLPDFLLYLSVRWILHHEKLIPSESDPIDEWALITFESKKFIEISQKKILSDINGLHERHRLSIVELERKEKPSYFIDQLIEQLNAAIGLRLSAENRFNQLAAPNSLKAYQLLIPYLAKLNRADRGKLVEFLINRVMRCQSQVISFRGFKFGEESDDAYLVLASKFEREERRIALSNIAMGMGHKLKAKVVIGIAVSSDWPELPIYDVVFVDVSKLKPSAELVDLVEIAFEKRPHVRLR